MVNEKAVCLPVTIKVNAFHICQGTDESTPSIKKARVFTSLCQDTQHYVKRLEKWFKKMSGQMCVCECVRACVC